MARMISFLRAHKRAITFSLVAFCAFLLTPSWGEVGAFYFLLFFAILVMLGFGRYLRPSWLSGFARSRSG
jgi:hypothetical protein